MKKTRDRERSIQKILQEATKSFLTEGRSGTRVDEVAKKAGLNKAMIYHYFGSKKRLYEQVLNHIYGQQDDLRDHIPKNLSEATKFWMKQLKSPSLFIKLIKRESVEQTLAESKLLKELVARHYGRGAEILAELKQKEEFPEQIDEKFFLMILTGAITIPFVFPELTRMIYGKKMTQKDFLEQYEKTLIQVLEHITVK